MCNYCGCRDFPLIGRLSEEHWEIGETAGALRRAVNEGRYGDATALLDELVGRLMPHTAVEEAGLFAELRAEGTLTEEVDRLCAEHDDIHGVLTTVDREAPDWPAVLEVLHRLHHHIDREEHGLFPASVIMLPIPAWDRITPDLRAPGGEYPPGAGRRPGVGGAEPPTATDRVTGGSPGR